MVLLPDMYVVGCDCRSVSMWCQIWILSRDTDLGAVLEAQLRGARLFFLQHLCCLARRVTIPTQARWALSMSGTLDVIDVVKFAGKFS